SGSPATVLVVLHFPENTASVLPAILNRRAKMFAKNPLDNAPLEPGQIYVARPGYHLLVKRDRIRLVAGPRENSNRPAIDPLFRTAARSRGPSVVSVILSGMLDDGTLGTAVVRRHGGITIAQDPESAMFPDMPRNAIQNVGVHHVLPLEEIAPKLIQLVSEPSSVDWEAYDFIDATEMDLNELHAMERQGRPSQYVCPECKGTLFELEEEGFAHFRCHVGHAYSVETLAAKQAEGLEAALWTALRSIEENNLLLHRMIARSEQRSLSITVANYKAKLAEGVQKARIIREALEVGSEPHEAIRE
ncbi:chemotaxis protein CheB, partial [bacterium]